MFMQRFGVVQREFWFGGLSFQQQIFLVFVSGWGGGVGIFVECFIFWIRLCVLQVFLIVFFFYIERLEVDSKFFIQYLLRIFIFLVVVVVVSCYFREGRLDLVRIGDQEDQGLGKGRLFCYCCFYLFFWVVQFLFFKGDWI